jgi:GDP-4-dehydro-6-deoxy-D-mannose reductase
VRELIELLGSATELRLTHELDPERIRPNDVPEVRGSAELLREATGWTPEIPLARTVADALDQWRVEIQ